MIELDELIEGGVARPIRDFYADPEQFTGRGGVAMGRVTKWASKILSWWDQGQINDDKRRFENHHVSSIVTRRRSRANWIRFIQDEEGKKRLFEATFFVNRRRIIVETFHLGLWRAAARFVAHYEADRKRLTLKSRPLLFGLVRIRFRTRVLPQWRHQCVDRRLGQGTAPETLLVIGKLSSIFPGLHGTFTAYLRRRPPFACATCPALHERRERSLHVVS